MPELLNHNAWAGGQTMSADEAKLSEALSRIQREFHEGTRQVLDRLHSLELSVSTRLNKTDADLRAEMAALRADTDRRFTELSLSNVKSTAANYKLVVTTALSIGAALATMLMEFGLKRFGG